MRWYSIYLTVLLYLFEKFLPYEVRIHLSLEEEILAGGLVWLVGSWNLGLILKILQFLIVWICYAIGGKPKIWDLKQITNAFDNFTSLASQHRTIYFNSLCYSLEKRTVMRLLGLSVSMMFGEEINYYYIFSKKSRQNANIHQ